MLKFHQTVNKTSLSFLVDCSSVECFFFFPFSQHLVVRSSGEKTPGSQSSGHKSEEEIERPAAAPRFP